MTGPQKDRDFYLATEEEIHAGKTTDVYFLRTLEVLKKAGKDKTVVDAEITTGGLPNGWPWGVLAGVEEAVHLLKGKNVSLWSLPEGTLFTPRTPRGIPLPVMSLEGPYGDWALYETPFLGVICQTSGIATKPRGSASWPTASRSSPSASDACTPGSRP